MIVTQDVMSVSDPGAPNPKICQKGLQIRLHRLIPSTPHLARVDAPEFAQKGRGAHPSALGNSYISDSTDNLSITP